VIQTITIEREYGSGAGAISRKLAEKLGWTLWDEKITQEIAKRLKCDVKSVEQREEKPDSTFYRLMKIFMRGSYEERFSGSGTELLDAESLSHLFEKVITDVANRGHVSSSAGPPPGFCVSETITWEFLSCSPLRKDAPAY
jgi:hypothetical protein